MSAAALIAAGLGLGTVLVFIQMARRFGWDKVLEGRRADWHHTHTGSVPRLGGAALAVAFIAIELWIAVSHPMLRSRTPGRDVLVVSSLAMFLLGFWDDVRPLSAGTKLLGQVFIASVVCWCGVSIEVIGVPFAQTSVSLGALGPVLTVFWLVSLTNLINLIDGVDGLAGGISLMLMILVAAVAHQGGSFELLACGMGGGLLGFLCFNFPPARIYLGDGGAYFLGFQVGLYSLANSHKGAVLAALIAPLFVLTFPVVDACLTLARRCLRGLPLFRADRDHWHHRLIALQCSRRKLLLCVYALNLLLLLLGLTAFWSQGQWLPMLFGAAAVLVFLCAGACRFSRRWFAVHRVVRNCWRMRAEVRYALSLAHWLELESRRRTGPDELWPDFVFAADKLGFAALKLTLENGQKIWRRPAECRDSVWRRYDCPVASFGRLEFGGSAGVRRDPQSSAKRVQEADGGKGNSDCLVDPTVFEVVSDLLAEAWNNAATEWQRRKIPLRFKADELEPGSEERVGSITEPVFQMPERKIVGSLARCQTGNP